MRHERKSFANSTDTFSLAKPPPVLDPDGNERVRKTSSRAQAKKSSTGQTESGVGKLMSKMKTSMKDTWRRMTESQCDPYVQVELRPGMYTF